MTIAAIRNRYNLDPFLPVVYPTLFGATIDFDVAEADSVWPLLMRGIYSVLYRDATQQLKKSLKKQYTNTMLPPGIAITPKEWTRAFNIITVTLYDAGRLLRPHPVDMKAPPTDWAPPLQLAASGKEKIRSYRQGNEKLRTRKILARMQRHCHEVLAKLPPDYRSQVPGLNEDAE